MAPWFPCFFLEVACIIDVILTDIAKVFPFNQPGICTSQKLKQARSRLRDRDSCDFFYLISCQFELRSYEYMKIIYVNYRGKNYMKVDRHSYRPNFCSCETKAWKKSGLYRISLNFFFRDCKSCIYNCDDLLWYFYSYNNSSYVETTSKNFVKNYQSMSFLGQMSKSNWTSLCEKKNRFSQT